MVTRESKIVRGL